MHSTCIKINSTAFLGCRLYKYYGHKPDTYGKLGVWVSDVLVLSDSAFHFCVGTNTITRNLTDLSGRRVS